jgi:hypothetical protein
MYRDTMNVEYKMYDYTGNTRFKEEFEKPQQGNIQ